MLAWFNSLDFFKQMLTLYFVVINLVAFYYFGIDKLKSQLSSRRISEKKLWTVTLIGGSLGALLGMYFFRHKTRKISFQAVIALILAVQILLIILIFK